MAAIQDIEDGKVGTTEIVKALQTVLLFLRNASQHHTLQHHQAILQKPNPQLKSLIKDEDFADAPPYLFGECFASLAEERLEAALEISLYFKNSKAGFSEATPKICLELWGWQPIPERP